ncbi:probable peroxygenase 3 [Euphorbia lathyris]|uniref:probable peroxygenase 3 n=1 Tax=Euphorbia lathyris TaxID=212925 RepID=UPI00331439DD
MPVTEQLSSRKGGEMEDGEDSMATTASKAPITSDRPVSADLETTLPKPYLARALIAPDKEHPNGTQGHDHNDMTVLQQHVAFFDQNNDGIVYPSETFKGCRQLGFNVIIALILTIAFHVFFSIPTQSKKRFPSLRFPIYIVNIHLGKHGSDTGVYDTEGRYMPVNLENMFSKYAKTVPHKLSFKELMNMTEGNRLNFDFIGWLAEKLEWILVYGIAKDEEGYLSKDSIRRLFDGSLFEYIAKKRKGGQAKMN